MCRDDGDADELNFSIQDLSILFGAAIEVLESKKEWAPEVKTAFNTGYDGANQGYEETAYVIFKLGDKYFRKEGTLDSYEGLTWNGKLVEVTPVEKTVIGYEVKR